MGWPISISIEPCLPGICLTPHDYFGPPPGPVPAAMPGNLSVLAFDFPTTMLWPVGFAIGQNKLTTDVNHKGMSVVLDGHDCGYCIPHLHVAPTPANTLTPMQFAFSSKKVMFSAGTVLMNGKPTAGCCPPMMMLYCSNPVSLPLAHNAMGSGSVFIGMTAGDVWAGVIAIGLTMAVDYLTKSSGKEIGKLAEGIKKSLAKEIAKKLLVPQSKKDWIQWGKKAVIGVITGYVKLSEAKGPGDAKVTLGGSDYAKVEGGLYRDKNGHYSIKIDPTLFGKSAKKDGYELADDKTIRKFERVGGYQLL